VVRVRLSLAAAGLLPRRRLSPPPARGLPLAAAAAAAAAVAVRNAGGRRAVLALRLLFPRPVPVRGVLQLGVGAPAVVLVLIRTILLLVLLVLLVLLALLLLRRARSRRRRRRRRRFGSSVRPDGPAVTSGRVQPGEGRGPGPVLQHLEKDLLDGFLYQRLVCADVQARVVGGHLVPDPALRHRPEVGGRVKDDWRWRRPAVRVSKISKSCRFGFAVCGSCKNRDR
ncbi:MAG: hypothetical protein BJ554DRAFT_2188, partial [Olpidium bornovanus]